MAKKAGTVYVPKEVRTIAAHERVTRKDGTSPYLKLMVGVLASGKKKTADIYSKTPYMEE